MYKKRKITEQHAVILGLNPLGQAICRRLYERAPFEPVFIFDSPAFRILSTYRAETKPPVIPVQAMVSDELMLVFGDVFVKDYEWVTDLLFFLRGTVPMRFLIGLQPYDGPTVGQAFSKKGENLLRRMDIPSGNSEFYDGLTAPMVSIGAAANIDIVILFIEHISAENLVDQHPSLTIADSQIETTMQMLQQGLDFHLSM